MYKVTETLGPDSDIPTREILDTEATGDPVACFCSGSEDKVKECELIQARTDGMQPHDHSAEFSAAIIQCCRAGTKNLIAVAKQRLAEGKPTDDLILTICRFLSH